MMRRDGVGVLAALLAVMVLCGGGCGGGGGSDSDGSGPAVPKSLLAWDPPTHFVDNTVLDPFTELDRYEFYLREDRNFTEQDVHMAEVSAVDNQFLVTEFNLNNLRPFVAPGIRCFLSIRAVGVDGAKSPFSLPIAWDTT